MKKILKSSVMAAVIVGCGATGAMATSDLFNWAFNIDGVVTGDAGDYITTGMPVTGALSANDLGVLTYTISGVGVHSFLAFFDYEIDEADTTFYNEYGSAVGTVGTGQTWEIDEPDEVFGNILSNIYNGSLDNTNGVDDTYSDPTYLEAGEDVAMAMGWDFTLLEGETATITLTLSDFLPQSAFYLSQFDHTTSEGIYFSSNLVIEGGGNPEIPEPTTMLLFGTGLAGLFRVRRNKRNS